jgi:phospholipid-transporting ATPase
MLAFNQANLSMINRELEIERVARMIENDFELVGATAIEDKLQDGVPETIRMIKQAGIKLWVLTGDKIETAVNIGYSCGLLDDSINQHVVNSKKSNDINHELQ